MGMVRPSLPVVIGLIMLVLSLLYALTFTYMLNVSVDEQLVPSPGPAPRYAGPVHRHNGTEWVLIVGPALLGWLGTGFSTTFLVRRWLDAPMPPRATEPE
jgi:hypothetical protein